MYLSSSRDDVVSGEPLAAAGAEVGYRVDDRRLAAGAELVERRAAAGAVAILGIAEDSASSASNGLAIVGWFLMHVSASVHSSRFRVHWFGGQGVVR
jgi:hypothetical protein